MYTQPTKVQISCTSALAVHSLRCLLTGWYNYRKIPKFLDASNLCCKILKIQTKRPNLKGILSKCANGIANSEDPDQTAPLGAV